MSKNNQDANNILQNELQKQTALQNQQRLQNMIFFQNLVPGIPASPFIKSFKNRVLNEDNAQDDEAKYREQLLLRTPPILSFRNKQQKEDFYKKEASDCNQFCCGGMVPIPGPGNNHAPKDNYVLSTGSGKLYQGSANEIKSQLQQDIRTGGLGEGFQSGKLDQAINGLNEFSNIVSKHNQSKMSSEPTESDQYANEEQHNPLKTQLKPRDE